MTCRILMLLTVLLALSSHFKPALAASEPINFEVGAGPGGGLDLLARQLATVMSTELGQPITVTNRPGGVGSTVLMHLKNSRPGGYRVGFIASSSLTYQTVVSNQYTLDDFRPLACLVTTQDAFIAQSGKPWKTLKEMFADAKENNRTILFASQSPVDKLIISYIAKESGVKVAAIPTQGGGEMIPKLLGGHVELAYSAVMHIPYLSTGQMVVLAALNDQRHPSAPETPTLKEMGWDISMNTFLLTVVPKDMPDDLVDKLYAAMQKASESQEYINLVDERLHMVRFFQEPSTTVKMLKEQQQDFLKLTQALE